MKAVKQYFPVVLYVLLYSVFQTFESVDETLKCDHSNGTYSTVLCLVVLFVLLYSVFLMFESVDETLKCDHSVEAIEQYFPVVLFV